MNVAAALAPLDAARSGLLRVLGRPGRTLLANRAWRVALYGVFGVFAALVLTCAAPLWAFALGPVLLGVPHLVADARYLVAKPRLLERRALAVGVFAPLAAVLVHPTSAVLGLAASLGAIVAAKASARVRLVAALVWLGVMAAAFRHPHLATLAVVHGHNLIAVALFLLLFARQRGPSALLPIALFVLASAAMLSGMLDAWILRQTSLSGGPSTGLSLDGIVASIAPLADPALAVRLACLFVFAQGVHYVIWLRLVPEEARERPGLRSFTSSFRALREDLGGPLLVVAGLGAISVLVLAARSLESARLAYLRAASPHAYLEIALAWFFLLERRRATDAP